MFLYRWSEGIERAGALERIQARWAAEAAREGKTETRRNGSIQERAEPKIISLRQESTSPDKMLVLMNARELRELIAEVIDQKLKARLRTGGQRAAQRRAGGRVLGLLADWVYKNWRKDRREKRSAARDFGSTQRAPKVDRVAKRGLTGQFPMEYIMYQHEADRN